MRLATAAAAAATAAASGSRRQLQLYGDGVGKTTHACSDPTTAMRWMMQTLPVDPDYWGPGGCTTAPDGLVTCNCGVLGRVVLQTPGGEAARTSESRRALDEGGPKGFGLHTVFASQRPFGEMNASQVEAIFTAKMAAMHASGGERNRLRMRRFSLGCALTPAARLLQATMPSRTTAPSSGRRHSSPTSPPLCAPACRTRRCAGPGTAPPTPASLSRCPAVRWSPSNSCRPVSSPNARLSNVV